MRALKKGFTLIELLVVVVIIGILAAIAIPKFSSTKDKSYFVTMASDLRNLINPMEIVKDSVGGYPGLAAFGNVTTAQLSADSLYKFYNATPNDTVFIGRVQSSGYDAAAHHASLGTGAGKGRCLRIGTPIGVAAAGKGSPMSCDNTGDSSQLAALL